MAGGSEIIRCNSDFPGSRWWKTMVEDDGTLIPARGVANAASMLIPLEDLFS
jgi:hypothetical protein